MNGEEGQQVVRFTVKELLAAMDGKLDRIAESIHAKADHATVDQLEQRVNALERWRSVLTGGYAVALIFLGYLAYHYL